MSHFKTLPIKQSLTNVTKLITVTRPISTTVPCSGRKNFRKFPIPNKRGIFEHAKIPKELLENEYDYPVVVDDMKIRYPGVWFGKKFVYVREMEPELVVPDFEDCPLKPYVSHRSDPISQSQFTAEQLFSATYGKEIKESYKNGQPVPESLLHYDEDSVKRAKNDALKTGADLFNHTSYFGQIEEETQ